MRTTIRRVAIAILVAGGLAAPSVQSDAHAAVWRKWVAGEADCVIPNLINPLLPPTRVFRMHGRVEWTYDTTRKKVSNVRHDMWFSHTNSVLFQDLGWASTSPDQFFAWKKGHSRSGHKSWRKINVGVGPRVGPFTGVTTWPAQTFFEVRSDGSVKKSFKCK